MEKEKRRLTEQELVPYLPYELETAFGTLKKVSKKFAWVKSEKKDYQNFTYIWIQRPKLLPLNCLTDDQLRELSLAIYYPLKGTVLESRNAQKKVFDFLSFAGIMTLPLANIVLAIEYLYSIHADVHGLIDADLADRKEVSYER